MVPPSPAAPPTLPPPGSYPPRAVPPPMAPPPHAPPRSDGLLAVLGIVALIVIAAIWWIFVASVAVPPSVRPEVSFSTPSITPAGAAQFNVTQVTFAYPGTSYRVNLEVDYVLGTTEWLTASTTVTVGSANYTVTWQDVDGLATLNAEDRFRVSLPGGLPAESVFRFVLLWADGATVGQTTWTVTIPKPVVGFTAVYVAGNASFSVAGVSLSLPIGYFRVNLGVDTAFGTDTTIPASGTPASISVSGTTYLVTWTDIGGEGKLTDGDRFAISGDNVPLGSGRTYWFSLLWYDGSLIQALIFTTP